MGPKRPSDGDLQHANKIPKIEPGLDVSPLAQQRALNSDFSGSVKRKLADSKRTGQACDRCKIRKIRCDGRPEGCSPCAQNRTPCKTTDRITGRATTRGHAEALESENGYLRAQLAELQAQLKEMGVEPRATSSYNEVAPPSLPWSSSSLGSDVQGWGDTTQRRTSATPLPGYAPASALEGTGPLPQFKQGSIGDNYLGVSSADSLLSNIKGTSLSLFGTEIDITDFVDDDDAYENSVMSYKHFLDVAMKDQPVDPVSLPPYQILAEYSTWYLRSLNPYTMLVDKPTFMQLIWRIGNEPNFIPSPAQTVCVHMMLATLKYQIAVRNGQTSMMEESHLHYRYSLSFFKDLLHGHRLEDIQALTLICHHLRNFPKPGAAWIMTSTTFLHALELGLHRSTKAWPDTAQKMDKLEIEMRKRIFWTLIALVSNLTGKLGRPMPISVEDIDVEFPEPLNDCLPGEDTHLTPFRKCSFQVGIQISKYTIWSMELYKTIYALRKPSNTYEETLKRLEDGIRKWKEELPPELKEPAHASQDDYIFALFLEYWYQEFQLLLHHPAVCRSTDPNVISSNLDKCLATAEKMLHNCNEMIKIRSLDIPWINAVVYIAAVFTTLFIHSQRKDQLSLVDMKKLRNDMDLWVKSMGEVGHLLGSGDKLMKAIRKIVDHSLSNIDESIVKRTATESLARAALQAPQEQVASTPVYGNGNFHESYSNAVSTTTDPALTASGSGFNALTAGAPYSYTNGTPVSMPQQTSSPFDQQTYGATEDPGMTLSHAAALAAAASGATTQRPDESYAYTNSQVANNGHQPSYSTNGIPPQDWRQWTRTYMQQFPPQGEYLNTATTLMALGGGREGSFPGPGQDGPGAVDGSAIPGPGPGNFQWPAIAFGVGANGHVGQH